MGAAQPQHINKAKDGCSHRVHSTICSSATWIQSTMLAAASQPLPLQGCWCSVRVRLKDACLWRESPQGAQL